MNSPVTWWGLIMVLVGIGIGSLATRIGSDLVGLAIERHKAKERKGINQ